MLTLEHNSNMFHTLYRICCSKLQNHLLLQMGNHTYTYVLKLILLYDAHTLLRYELNSWSTQCEMSWWGICNETHWLCIFSPRQILKSKYHTLLKLSSFVVFDRKILKHQETQINFTHTKWKCSSFIPLAIFEILTFRAIKECIGFSLTLCLAIPKHKASSL